MQTARQQLHWHYADTYLLTRFRALYRLHVQLYGFTRPEWTRRSFFSGQCVLSTGEVLRRFSVAKFLKWQQGWQTSYDTNVAPPSPDSIGRFTLVMGDSAEKKTNLFDSIQCHTRVDSIQFDSIRCSVRTSLHSPHQGFWTLVLKLLDQSIEAMTGRPALHTLNTVLLLPLQKRVATLTRMWLHIN